MTKNYKRNSVPSLPPKLDHQLRMSLRRFLPHHFHPLYKIHPHILKAVYIVVEKELIYYVMRHHRGNQVRSAHTLGINRNTLRSAMKDYGLNDIDWTAEHEKPRYSDFSSSTSQP
jgi:DNA-binding protein Fis